MARGLESKSVEEQMANTLEAKDESLLSDEDKKILRQHKAVHERQKQALTLQRENILSQRTSNVNRRAALEAALSQIDAQLQALG
jgi:hypothetical protein